MNNKSTGFLPQFLKFDRIIVDKDVSEVLYGEEVLLGGVTALLLALVLLVVVTQHTLYPLLDCLSDQKSK